MTRYGNTSLGLPTHLSFEISDWGDNRFETVQQQLSAALDRAAGSQDDRNDVIRRAILLHTVVSYEPRGVERGGWHRLEVKVKRPGVKVKARPGYLAR